MDEVGAFAGKWGRHAVGGVPRWKKAAAIGLVCAVVLASGGCSKLVKDAVNHVLDSNKEIDAFTQQINTTPPKSYLVTYVTTGSTPATVTLAGAPPSSFYFGDVQTGSDASTIALVENSSAFYDCNRAGSAKFACNQLASSQVKSFEGFYALYQGAHWIDIIKGYVAIASIGQKLKVQSGTKTVNGLNLSCIDVSNIQSAPHSAQFCVTSAGFLGFVQVGTTTDFEIKSYSTSPPASMFQPPAGASITKVTIPATSVPTTT